MRFVKFVRFVRMRLGGLVLRKAIRSFEYGAGVRLSLLNALNKKVARRRFFSAFSVYYFFLKAYLF